MFIPDGSSSQLNFPSSSECVNSVISNREHTVVAVLSDTSIYFYLTDSCLLACVFRREEEDIRERGLSRKAYWKPDSTAICVTTANNFLNIYSVEIAQSPSSFNLHDPVSEFARKSSEFFLAQKRPQINVNLAVVAKLESPTACLLSFKEDLILCLKDGWLHRLTWAGVVLQELSFNIRSITADHHPHRNSMSGLPQKAAPAPTKFVADIAPFLGGIAAVLNHGRALLLLSNTTNFQPDSITVLWAHGLADACCCTANFKFRLIYFGCKNGDIAGYSIDDMNGELVQLFRIHLAIKNGIEYLERLSSVCQISCLIPNGTAFAVIWSLVDKQEEEETDAGEKLAAVVNGAPHENGESVQSNKKFCPPTLAIFSPFGEQWWCSLEDNAGIADYQGPSPASSPPFYTGLDWTVEGYQLWLGTSGAGLQLLNLIRSIPCVHDQLMMAGADRLYLCPSSDQLISDNQQMNATAPRLVWQLLKPPHNYIASNWPIKHIALGQSPDKVVAVGGSHGFCFYNFKVAKWRMFRKEAQEKSLLLTGGLALFDEFIVCSACNLETKVDDSDRLYVFKMKEQLDLDLAQSTPTSRVLIMQMSESYLLTFDVNSVVSIYTISKKPGSGGRKQTSEVELECDVEIRIAEFMPHPNCLIAMELAKLNFHADAMPFCHGMDSLLVNIAGHLLLLSPMKTQFNGQDKNKVEDNVTEFQFHPPTLVASFVEDFWIIHPPSVHQQQQTLENGNGKIPYLSEAIWINAGCKKSRIWLPLSLEMQKKQKSPTAGAEKKKSKSQLVQQNSRTFISRRIMLPFSMDIYPLFINSNYLACGVNCTSTQLKSTGGGAKLVADNVSLTSKLTEDDSSVNDSNAAASSDDRESGPAAAISVYSVVQTTEVFIHKLLKQLLKRNLGSYAFELATECRSLPYFGHILELLLHDLLEEEATSSEPIPDPLLPTVVSFLHEFPDEYLQTIVHCARKTELAYWKLLFSASHHPRQLFQMCIREGRLETATSCLIILQSLVGIHESSKYAYQLLEKALTRRRWDIAQDIIRFMQNINRASERDGLIDGLIAGLRESPFFRGM